MFQEFLKILKMKKKKEDEKYQLFSIYDINFKFWIKTSNLAELKCANVFPIFRSVMKIHPFKVGQTCPND